MNWLMKATHRTLLDNHKGFYQSFEEKLIFLFIHRENVGELERKSREKEREPELPGRAIIPFSLRDIDREILNKMLGNKQ